MVQINPEGRRLTNFAKKIFKLHQDEQMRKIKKKNDFLPQNSEIRILCFAYLHEHCHNSHLDIYILLLNVEN